MELTNLWHRSPTSHEAGDRLTITTSNGGRVTGHLSTSYPQGFSAPGVTHINLHKVDGVPNPDATYNINTSRVTGIYRA